MNWLLNFVTTRGNAQRHSQEFASNCIHKFFRPELVIRRMQFEANAGVDQRIPASTFWSVMNAVGAKLFYQSG